MALGSARIVIWQEGSEFHAQALEYDVSAVSTHWHDVFKQIELAFVAEIADDPDLSLLPKSPGVFSGFWMRPDLYERAVINLDRIVYEHKDEHKDDSIPF